MRDCFMGKRRPPCTLSTLLLVAITATHTRPPAACSPHILSPTRHTPPRLCGAGASVATGNCVSCRRRPFSVLALQASNEATVELPDNSELSGDAVQATAAAARDQQPGSTGWVVKIGQTQLVCPASNAWGCFKVLTSPWASVGPVPLAAVGLVVYAAIAVLSLQPRWEKNEALWRLCFALAVASLGLMAVLIFVLEAPCTFCALSAFISALLLIVLEAAQAQATGSEARRSSLVLATMVAFGALRGATMIGKDDNSFYALVQKYKPEHPPVRSTSSEAEKALARHLKTIGAACYTAWWCPHCQDQREKFGREATLLAPFVECAEANRGRKPECRANKDIDGFPTWIIAGKRFVGAQEMSKLAEVSGFTDFPADAFTPRSDEATTYIWGEKLEK